MSLPPVLLVFALFTLNPVTISVYPPFIHEGGGIRVRAIIERHAQNRSLVLEAVRFHVFQERRTPFEIHGAQSQRVFTPTNACICWMDLPAGEYDAVAILTRMEDGHAHRYRSVQPFRVIGPDDP